MNFNQLDFVRQEIAELDGVKNRETLKNQPSGPGFFGRIHYALKLIFLEKEIILFSVLQIAVIAAAYYLWVEMLGWIPESVWRSAENSDKGSIADLVLFLWSFFCVGIAAFPLGLLSGCIGTAHFLHRSGKSSTIAACMQTVLAKAWPLWFFHWMDGWITVNQILNRLPKKNDRRSFAEKALSETLYYAWKLGTMGILPSLILGKSLGESGRNAVQVVKAKLFDLSKLRLGYSMFCWITGIAAYAGAAYFLFAFDPLPHKEVYGKMYELYRLVGIPLVIAVAVIQIFLRPVYLISLCDIYSDYLQEKGEQAVLPESPNPAVSALVIFGLICLLAGVVFLYRYQLGIMDMLAVPYGGTYQSPR